MSCIDSQNQAFQRAVELIDGRQQGMAKLIGRTQGAISKRMRSGKPIWPEAVLPVEAATGVSRHDLRPDLYPREPVTLSHPAEATSAETVPAASSPASPAPIGDQAGGGRDNNFKGGVPVT